MIIKGIPYFFICNKGDQIPAALIPDKKGIYYKENFLASQPEFYMHMVLMEDLGADRFVWPEEPKKLWVKMENIERRLEPPEFVVTDSGIPLFAEFPSISYSDEE
ncbi:unnamed protein product [Oikopleura dioica]|uniref:Uncharacterized protein n=1 Tax=Oikopleura dioica TaxID=34765 RepID=E4YAZ0_OIKDI|nr:unnamed protein product [Oikopleura dioica]